MRKPAISARTLAVLAALASGPAVAQTDDAEAPAAEGPQPGQTYVADIFGDWEMRCAANPEGADPCNIYQLLQDEAGNAVAEISIVKLPEGGAAEAGATVVTPLETLLTRQVSISVDGGAVSTYPFLFCSEVGCVARVGFTTPEVDSFRRGAEALLQIVPAGNPAQTVDLTISLSGFTAGFEALAAAEN